MIRFRLLGTVDLRDSEGRELRSVLRRPKLLALLGYLAAARPPGFHRRDTLVALFWPELDNAHARNALRQAVHALRQSLGHAVVLARGEEEVALAEECLSCDLREFEKLLGAEQAESALELYRGALLNGLHVSEAPEFERWLDAEREHARRRACQAAEGLTDRAGAVGNPPAAARWALGFTELSPFDETAVRRLIQLLDRAGDQAGAVRAYEEFERRIGRDLEVQPSSATSALVQVIRARQPRDTAAAVVGMHELTEHGVPALGRNQAPRTRGVVLVALLAAALVAGGWLLVRGRATPAPKRLVVLPFANLGSAEDEYFADGITEEIAVRLAAIDRLRVIARTSANRYKHTDKSIPEIGRELGVGYVLEGSVRWERSPSGEARVRVTPQLVNTADGMHLWAQVYDEPLDEIFRVQSDIAQQVVGALDVTLLEPERRTIGAVPTHNLQAYDYYLRGQNYARHGLGEPFQRTAARLFEKAIESDSGFALAYAMLSRAHSRIYLLHYDHSPNRMALAKWAVDRAFALESDLPEAHQSLGTYYWIGHTDYDRALREYAIAEAGRPSEYELFVARAVLRGRQGNFRDALSDWERALELDPGSPTINSNFGEYRDITHDFARAESLYDRAIDLSPDWVRPYFFKAGLYLRRDGSTARARGVLDEATTVGLGETPEVAFAREQVAILDRRYDEAIARLSSGFPAVFADQQQFVTRAQLYAHAYALMQRRDREREYADSARRIVVAKLREQPDDSRLHSALGIAYAGLGRKQEAIQEGRRGVELRPISRDTYQGYYREWDLARIYVMVGEYDAAMDRLGYLTSIPGYLTPAWLRLDPTWDPLRGHPRFQRLLDRR